MEEMICEDGSCGFGICEEELDCTSEPGLCSLANFLEAEESAFHDKQLIEATRTIKDVLAKIPADKKGRKLSVINSKSGLLLAWVYHGRKDFGDRKGKEVITHQSDKEKIAAALKLKR